MSLKKRRNSKKKKITEKQKSKKELNERPNDSEILNGSNCIVKKSKKLTDLIKKNYSKFLFAIPFTIFSRKEFFRFAILDKDSIQFFQSEIIAIDIKKKYEKTR